MTCISATFGLSWRALIHLASGWYYGQMVKTTDPELEDASSSLAELGRVALLLPTYFTYKYTPGTFFARLSVLVVYIHFSVRAGLSLWLST